MGNADRCLLEGLLKSGCLPERPIFGVLAFDAFSNNVRNSTNQLVFLRQKCGFRCWLICENVDFPQLGIFFNAGDNLGGCFPETGRFECYSVHDESCMRQFGNGKRGWNAVDDVVPGPGVRVFLCCKVAQNICEA